MAITYPDCTEFNIQGRITVEADDNLVKFLLMNLLENACKFSPKGGLIEVGETQIDGQQTFFVRDHGIGFDMIYLNKVFLPFERLVTEDQFTGTGIGLANVHRIVQLHGGRVWAESQLGKGSTFFFTLAPAPAAEQARK
jgi:signal transduction histidine kinase